MTDPARRTGVRDVEYKGAPLDSEKGPGLGCFWTQIVVLVVLLALTPLSVAWGWPFWTSAALLISVLLLLLVAGQTVIFLLRLVAADRRAAGRRRPLASSTPTVGELEDRGADAVAPAAVAPAAVAPAAVAPAAVAPAAVAPAAVAPADDPPGTPGGVVRE
ncbi:MAG: hypothetical protein C0498_05495 [Anaerolinea sp.]|nr:hypothetical protein [Anaerolinea sp.]